MKKLTKNQLKKELAMYADYFRTSLTEKEKANHRFTLDIISGAEKKLSNRMDENAYRMVKVMLNRIQAVYNGLTGSQCYVDYTQL